MASLMLSPNFSLDEMLLSQTAIRLGFTEQYNPPQLIIENMRVLCVNILQPLREQLGYSLNVNSGYRCPRLNRYIGGARNSQHMHGQAADIIDIYNGNGHLLQTFLHSGLPYDQVIDEFGLSWIHVSYDHFRTNRFQRLKALKDPNGRTRYEEMRLADSIAI